MLKRKDITSSNIMLRRRSIMLKRKDIRKNIIAWRREIMPNDF
jgi:hypothetical protein